MDEELLNAVVIVLALVVIGGLVALFVARHISLRRSVSLKVRNHSRKARSEG